MLIPKYLAGKSFKEPDIRKLATEKGLRVNGKPIVDSYSRSIISRLYDQKFLRKVKRGLYRFKRQLIVPETVIEEEQKRVASLNPNNFIKDDYEDPLK